MRIEPEPRPALPTTVLGDWYADLVHIGREQLVLCVSEKTLLPIVLPATQAKLLPLRLPEALFDVLKVLGISPSAIERELMAMQAVTVGRTASRSVVGTLTDFTFALQYRQDNESFVNLALWLAHTPCGPLKMSSPDLETVAAFVNSLH